jgi:hypothetical protein
MAHRGSITCSCAVAVLFVASGARGNGAFPDEFSVHFPTGSPSRILIGANFGLLISEDQGATWRYSCEPWVVAGSNAAINPESSVSYYQVTADGVVLADAVNVTRSADVGCTWPTATGSLDGQVITDIFASPADPRFVLAAVAIVNGGYIVASHDGGTKFDAPHLLDTADVLTGIEIARSNPAVLYATSIGTSGGSATLLKSTDQGATWTTRLIPTSGPGTQPRVLAVDPADENKVYVRLISGIHDAIAITSDGGQSFQDALTIDGRFTSFLRATDGTLYAGTAGGTLYVRAPGATDFTLRPAPHLRCLGQRFGEPKRFYACGDFTLDGYNLYFTDDGGTTFTPVMKFTDIQGPLGCLSTTCAAHWERIQGVLGIGTVPDAGQGGGGGGGGGGTPSGGSHCGSVGAGATTLLLLLAFTLRRGSHS